MTPKLTLALLGLAFALTACGDGDIGGEDDGGGGDGGSGLSGTGAGNVGGSGTGTNTGTGGSPTGTATGTGGSPTGTATGTATGTGTGTPPAGCTADGLALIDAINAYRAQNSLPAIPASSSLCIVADTHVTDLAVNAPHAPQQCNLHSWSDQGSWSACCYTPDHAQAACMWNKPSELTSYNSNGYEISYAGSNNPQNAVNAWSGSPGHNDVILNNGQWMNFPWGAVGAAQHDGFAHVWFGTAPDP